MKTWELQRLRPNYVKHGCYRDKCVLIRFPFPYEVRVPTHPGNGDEKCAVRREHDFGWRSTVQVYHYLSCSVLPSRMGVASSNQNTCPSPGARLETSTLLSPSFETLSGMPVCNPTMSWHLGLEYIVLQFVEGTTGHMLSSSWSTLRRDSTRRANLFQDLSNIMFALASQSFSRISSLTTDNEGFVHATNRPLALRLHHMENEGIPTEIPRNVTYCTSEAYVLDLLRCHDNQIRHKPNAISDKYDGRARMAALAAMRTIRPHYL